MEAGVGDKETKRTKWRETRAATHSEQEQAKVNPRRENHFTAVTETTEWWGLRVSMQSGGRGGIAFLNWGSFIKDVRKIFGILDPLPPLFAFWAES